MSLSPSSSHPRKASLISPASGPKRTTTTLGASATELDGGRAKAPAFGANSRKSFSLNKAKRMLDFSCGDPYYNVRKENRELF